MKKILSSALTSLILLAAGLCLVINPGAFMHYACYIAGGIAIAIAAIKFLTAYKNNTIAKETVPCVILLALGIVLIVLKGSILEIFPLIIGICFLVYGLLRLVAAFAIKQINESAFKKLLISAIIEIVLAILIIVLKGVLTTYIYYLIGALLIYSAFENIFSIIVAKPEDESKKKKAPTKKDAIAAESKDADDEDEEEAE